jgi:ubiquinone/menaquinone biosynthesis C-methylase UbiE
VRRAVRAAAALAMAAAFAHTVAAQLGSRPVEEWVKVLESPERLAGLKVDEVVARLELQPGQVVADLGAGTGPFVLAFARAVGPKGKVYAVEIERKFFPYIEQKVKGAGVTNVQTVTGEFTDPKLPSANVDVAFMHDVLHHVEARPAYLKSVVRYLKPGGRLAIVDYYPEHSPHRDDSTLQVTRAQAAGWLIDLGFKAVEDVPLFTDKWFTVYRRTDVP